MPDKMNLFSDACFCPKIFPCLLACFAVFLEPGKLGKPGIPVMLASKQASNKESDQPKC
jgi:hypothetical protein